MPTISEREALKHKASLDRAALLCHTATEAAGAAHSFATTEEGRDAALQALTAANDALNELMQAGASAPHDLPQPDPFDLSTLTALDTPDARELLGLLTRAQAGAEPLPQMCRC